MRKEFEKLPEIAAELENSDGELYWCDKQNQYRNNRVFQDSQTGWMNGAWYAWQAKAQAVQEGLRKNQEKVKVYELHVKTLKQIHENEFNEKSESSYILGNLDGFFECLESDLGEIK